MKFLSLVTASLMLASCASQMQAKKDDDLTVGKVDREAIRKVIRADVRNILKCYEEALTRDKSTAGKLLVEWDISKGGKVSRAKVVDDKSEIKDEILRSCVVTRISGLTFPEPPTSSDVTVVFPFHFKDNQKEKAATETK